MYATKIAALIAFCAVGALADDVYADFYNQNGDQIASVSYDVSDPGCFSVAPAYQVKFHQNIGAHFDGPYCLHAYTATGCPGDPSASQEFKDLDGGVKYPLDGGIVDQFSYKWQATTCG